MVNFIISVWPSERCPSFVFYVMLQTESSEPYKSYGAPHHDNDYKEAVADLYRNCV